jgi:hypothetical protein
LHGTGQGEMLAPCERPPNRSLASAHDGHPKLRERVIRLQGQGTAETLTPNRQQGDIAPVCDNPMHQQGLNDIALLPSRQEWCRSKLAGDLSRLIMQRQQEWRCGEQLGKNIANQRGHACVNLMIVNDDRSCTPYRDKLNVERWEWQPHPWE